MSQQRNRSRHYKPRTPTKRAIAAAVNAFRPIDAPEIEMRKPRRRDWTREDRTDGIGGADRPDDK